MTINTLTNTKIRHAKPGGRPRKLFDGRGMFLLLTPGGGKWWRFKYRFGGKAKTLSLGVYPDVGLREARERRLAARTLLGSAVDPSEERKAAKAAAVAVERRARDTMEAVAREWFKKFFSRMGFQSCEHSDPSVGARRLPVARRSTYSRRYPCGIPDSSKQICGQVLRYAIATGRAPAEILG